MDDFKALQKFIDEMQATSSSNNKKEILKKYKDNEFIMKILLYTNDPYITYGVTSSACKKYIADIDMYEELYTSIIDLLDDLKDRLITGNKALHEVNKFIVHEQEYEDLIYDIIDRDIKTRANASLINKVFPGFIPEFKVALANKYEDKLVDFNKDEWYASRKLDGVRCICKMENRRVNFYSREGKEFKTLGTLKIDLFNKEIDDLVLDGEVCIVENGVENFQGIMKEIRKKNHTIQSPKYFIFDALTIEEFNNKKSDVKLIDRLKRIPEFNNSEILTQTRVNNKKEFEDIKEFGVKSGYEGIMLRKNVGYKGKRSNDLLKVKTFMDAEYKVKDVINDNMRFFENGEDIERITLAAVVITHKGYKVKVGSGFSKEQREYYYKNPNEIIGKTITVNYFEETKNQDGGLSLRFPTFKCLYDKERDI